MYITLYGEAQEEAMISEHVIQVERVMGECKEIFEVIIYDLIHAEIEEGQIKKGL